MASAGICAIGSKTYVMGGCDYHVEVNDGTTFTNVERTSKIKHLGARLLAFDISSIEAGWKELKSCLGTPRWCHTMVPAGASRQSDQATKHYPEKDYCSDVFVYLITTETFGVGSQRR